MNKKNNSNHNLFLMAFTYDTKVFIIVYMACVVLPTLAVSISSLVIGGQNVNVSCDMESSTAFIRLPSWVLADGYFSLSCIFLVLFFEMLYYATEEQFLRYFSLIVTSVECAFVTCWLLVGATQIFRDSQSCLNSATSLWAVAVAAFIWDLFKLAKTIGIIVYGIKY